MSNKPAIPANHGKPNATGDRLAITVADALWTATTQELTETTNMAKPNSKTKSVRAWRRKSENQCKGPKAYDEGATDQSIVTSTSLLSLSLPFRRRSLCWNNRSGIPSLKTRIDAAIRVTGRQTRQKAMMLLVVSLQARQSLLVPQAQISA